MSAPMSPCRTRKRRSPRRSRTIARAPSAPPTRCGSTACCARPIPTSKVFWTISTPARPVGIASLDKAVVLGAGGAARAVVYALLERGIERVVVANRTERRAEALRERFGARVHPTRWDERNAALDGAALVVNTTTLGMPGQPELALDSWAPAQSRRRRRSRLLAAGHAACSARHGRANCAPPTGLAC